MRGYYKLFVLISGVLALSAITNAQRITYEDSWGNQGFSLLKDDGNSIDINFSIAEFYMEDLDMDGVPLKSIKVPGIFLPNDEGAPNLAGTGKYVAIPQGAKVTYTIIALRTEVFENVDIAPAPRIPLDTEDGPLHYEKNLKIYSINAFYPSENIQLKTSKIRGVDVVMVGITPFQYNPVTKELIIYRDLQIELKISGGNNIVGENRLRSRWWDPIILDAVLNPNSISEVDYSVKPNSSKDGEYEYLVICPDDPTFIEWADSIKVWRTLQGISTGVYTTTAVGGNTTTAIETFVNNAYDTWSSPPAAVLLLGDYGTSGNTVVSPIYNSYCVSDNIYADFDGDHLPDIVFARMTAQNETHLETMITKFLNYERYPPTSANFYNNPITALGWQTERWFQICSETVGGFWKNVQGKDPVRINEIYSGTPGSNWSTATNTATVVDYFGPNGLGYIPELPSTLGGWSGGNASMINTAINNGAFMLQHRDHGYEQGWGEPDYSSSDIDGLSNTDLPWIFSINCLTGKYNYSSEVFTEKFHRFKYNGQNSGALGLTAASEVSYSFVNDTYVWGLMDNMWTNFMPDYGTDPPSRDVLPAFANAAGKIFLAASSWPYNTSNKEVTYNLFHHHGDAFTTVYSEVPQYLTVTHVAALLGGANSFTVTSDVGSFIALTVNGEIIGVADGTGSPVAISIPSQNAGDILVVTITKQNYYRYSAEVNIIPPDGPHVSYYSHTINDASGNGNGLADFGENILLNMTVENLGNELAENVTATLISNDPYITITNNEVTYGTINSGETSIQPNAFALSLAEDVPDQQLVEFDLEITDGTDTWNSPFSITINAPQLEVGNMTIDDNTGGNGNGMLDPGETANIIIETSNNGHSLSPTATTYLSSISSWLTLNSTSYDLGQIDIGTTVDASFNITVDPGAPIGTSVDLDFDVIAGNYNASNSFMVSIGLTIEDWETGDFNKLPWINGGNTYWAITTDGPFEGTYCAKSGAITDSQVSDLQVTRNVIADGNMTFYRNVSSESGYDYLKFFIDDVLLDQWAGEIAWGQASFPVTAGVHTFKWQYYKDGSVSSGSDCALIDYIIFPHPVPPLSPPYQTEFEDLGSMPEGWYNDSGDDFNWAINSGTTPSSSTGPIGDHTSGSGYYIYTESSSPNYPSKQADLITPTFDLSSFSDVEVRFWYHMYGAEMGVLHLDVYQNEVWINDVMTPISGDQGDQWFEQEVNLTAYAGEIIKLRFRGITGSSYTSDIAIDDFAIYGTTSIPYINVNLTAFLEGPFVSSEMTTNLNSSGYIPLNQPYNIQPWNYSGEETVTSIPNTNVVDWVLVEIRETSGNAGAATPLTTIGRKAGFVLKNGSIVDIDGYSLLRFDITISDNLYAIVYHRNHLGIMSAFPLFPSGDTYTYNFSTGMGQVFGDLNGHIEIAPGIWGMATGDADSDGEIDNKDKNDVWKTQLGITGYFNGDFDLNGQVELIDRNLKWKTNAGNCSFIVK